MAPSVQRRLAAERAALAAAAEEEEGDGEPGGVLGVLYDASKPFQWAADKGEDVVRGAWNGVAEPVGMVVDLVNPFDSDGFFGDWKNLGSGLWYGVTHPLEFGKALIGWDVLKEEGVFYWAGNLIPGAVAAFFTGGASAALRGGSASARVLENTEDVLDAASDVQRIERSVDAAEDVDDAVAAARAGDGVPEGRTDLSRGFTEDLDNFTPGSATFHSGPTDGDMTLVQYFDADNPGSTKWWTSADEANSFETMDDVIEGLALSPDWGPRTGVRVAHIPEGTDVSFLHGTAGPQYPSTGGKLDGGAEQFRFLDFDEDWIVSTRRLP